ncbi:fibronectin type III domain-containing protein [Nostocoides australiense]
MSYLSRPRTPQSRPGKGALRVLFTGVLGASLLLGAGAPAVARSISDEPGTSARDTQRPTAPTGLKAMPGSYGVTLKWTASRDNVGVAYYRVVLGSKVRTPTGTSTFIGSLSPNTTYTASVQAFDAAGNSSPAVRITFRTKVPAESQPPSTPTNLTADPTTDAVTLTWTPSTDNVKVAQYVVTVGSLTLAVTEPRTTITGLTADTAYRATVMAKDTSGNTSGEAAVDFRTVTTADTQAPTAPTALSATPTTNAVTLTWTASTDNVGVVGYDVTIGSTTQTVTGSPATVTGLSPTTAYRATVVAKDAAGNVSTPAVIDFRTATPADTQAPSAPTGLSATPTTDAVTVNWTASTDNVGVAAYDVTVGDTTKTVTGTSAAFTGLTPTTAYRATVVAKDAAGNSSTPATVDFRTTTPPDTQAPTAPTNLRATADSTSANLTWTASSDNVGVTGYVVSVGSITQTVTTTSATVTRLSAATTYTARVVAEDAAGNQSTAASVTFTTAANPTGKVIYVSPDGSDANPGTAGSPKRTIQAAVDLAEPGTVIRLYAGTYANGTTIRIRTSGRSDAPIVIQPAGNGEVTVTHPVTTASCSNSAPASDRTFTFSNGVDHWRIENLNIHNGVWIAGKRSNYAYNWLTNYVNNGDWASRRRAPGHGEYNPAAARTDLVPFLRAQTGQSDLDMAEGITIRGNHLTGRGVYGALTSYGEISGNRIDQIPCGIGPGIWLMTFSNGWKIFDNDVSDIAISHAAHYMQEGIRVGSAANYNEIYDNYVHDLPGDGRGINTDVDGSWNHIHHNRVENVAIGYNDQMSGWGNRWEYNTVTNYRVYGMGFRLKDATLVSPSLASSTNLVKVRCNVTANPVGDRAKALGVGASIDGTWIGNTMPKIWLSKNLRVYWTAQGNTWNGSSALPGDYPPQDTSMC